MNMYLLEMAEIDDFHILGCCVTYIYNWNIVDSDVKQQINLTYPKFIISLSQKYSIIMVYLLIIFLRLRYTCK